MSPPIKHSSQKKIKETGIVASYELPGGKSIRNLLRELIDAKVKRVQRSRKITPRRRRNLEKAL